MNNPMTPEAIVRVIAERMGWSDIAQGCYDGSTYFGHHPDFCVGKGRASMPDYLHSLDALAPVLATLTDEEWLRFIAQPFDHASSGTWAKVYLTLPPETLAPLVARAIVESK